MTDLKSIIDTEMEKVKANPKSTEESRSFYDSILTNQDMKMAIAGMMETISRTFAGIVMSNPACKEDFIDMLTTRGAARPFLEMALIGYNVGKSVGQSESLEKMFSPERAN